MKSFLRFPKVPSPTLSRFFLTTSKHSPLSTLPPFRIPQRPIRYRRTALDPPSHVSRPARRQYADQKPSYNPTPQLNSPTPSLSLSQRLRKLSREYGWSAFGVYMLLTALDFPFCFAAVRYVGADRIGHYEHVLVEGVKSAIPEQIKERWRAFRRGGDDQASTPAGRGDGTVNSEHTGYDHGVREAEEWSTRENASKLVGSHWENKFRMSMLMNLPGIWTQLALAYAIHKSFIFIRVPVTVAITPKVVKVLRGWGWDIGKRRPKT